MRLPALLCFAGIIVAIGGGMAHAEGMYAGVQLGGGYGTGKNDGSGPNVFSETGVAGSGHLGVNLDPVLLEVELAYRYNFINDASRGPADGVMWSRALMGNIYLQFEVGEESSAYFGAGLGVASVSVDSDSLSADDTDPSSLAYQIMIGAVIPVLESTSVVIDLRGFLTRLEFVDTGGTPLDMQYTSGTVMIGLRYEI